MTSVNNNKTITTLFHKNCSDGTAACAVMELYARLNGFEHLTHAVQYGDPVPELSGAVYIVDFSYSRDIITELHDRDDITSLTVIDHHKTAQSALEGLDYCVFDMNHSGAVLTWKHMFTDKPVPQFLLYVEDRDLWKWEMDLSKEFSAGLQLSELDYNNWCSWISESNAFESVFDTITSNGSAVLQYQNMCVKRVLAKDLRIVTIGGYSVPLINTTHLISEIGSALVDEYPFVIMYFDTNTHRIHSLRSNGGVDVGQIAKLYFNGGGHAKAASGSLPIEDGYKLFFGK